MNWVEDGHNLNKSISLLVGGFDLFMLVSCTSLCGRTVAQQPAPLFRLRPWYDPPSAQEAPPVLRLKGSFIPRRKVSPLVSLHVSKIWKCAKLDPYIMTMYKGKRRNHRCKFTRRR